MRVRSAVVFGSVLGTVFGAVPAGAALPVDVGVEPWGEYGIRIDGTGGEALGWCGLDFGDINGDGYTDVVAATPYADTDGHTDNGGAVVVLGSANPGNISTATLGESGFRIIGTADALYASYYLRVTVAGDVNGDGYEDILIAQDDYTVFLVLGAPGTATVDLATPSSRVVALEASEADSNNLGEFVGGVGDLNGDGLDDFAVGDGFTDDVTTNGGTVWVVYGAETFPATLDLSAPPASVSVGRVNGSIAEGNLGISTNDPGRGDWNGDFLDDLLIAAAFADTAAGIQAGTAYVVFGREDPLGTVNLGMLGEAGVSIPGIVEAGRLGDTSLAWAGDVTGSFADDLILSAAQESPNDYGESYIVPGGGSGAIDLASEAVVRLYDGTPTNQDYFGFGVNAAGDVNGDGFADVIVANSYQDPGGVDNAGTVEILFGPVGPEDIDFDQWDAADGIRFHGTVADDYLGYCQVAGRADFNGDGGGDVAFHTGADSDTGAVYVYFGNPPPVLDIESDGLPGRALTLTASPTDDTAVAPAAWDFGDGTPTTSAALSTSHTFMTSGRVEVFVEASDEDGGRGFGIGLAFPCLTTSPFTDLSPTGFGTPHIGCLRDLGVVSGTTATMYAPGSVVTREQMAIFLMTTWELYTGATYSGETMDFTDIASSFAATRIRQLAGLGITSGTAPGVYSPAGVVTREQMAVFLMNLYEELTFGPYTGPTVDFTDIASSFAVTRIRQLAGLGITTGTAPGIYSPTAAVTREQMAVFVTALLDAAA